MPISNYSRYQLVRRMAPTPFGQSYEAIHPRRPGRFLVETLTDLRGELERIAAFGRDLEAIASLRHPYILQALEIDNLPDGTPILVSELPEGDTLEAWLANGHVPSRAAVTALVTALGSALHAAHVAGVSHGDVGAHTVLLLRGPGAEMGLPKLVGFGRRAMRADAASATALDGRAADLTALARLAERLLAKELEVEGATELGAARPERPAGAQDPGVATFFLPPATKAALERALAADDVEPFESTVAFAAALATSLHDGDDDDAAGGRRARSGRAGGPPRLGGLVVAASVTVALAAWAPAWARVQVRRWLSAGHVDAGDAVSATTSLVPPAPESDPPLSIVVRPPPAAPKDGLEALPEAAAPPTPPPRAAPPRHERSPRALRARIEPSPPPEVLPPTIEVRTTEADQRPRRELAEPGMAAQLHDEELVRNANVDTDEGTSP